MHRHKWIVQVKTRFGQVERCEICPKLRTLVMDYSQNKVIAMEGNLLGILSSFTNIYILCKDEEEFKEICHILRMTVQNPPRNLIQLKTIKQLEQMHPLQPIYFYGEWLNNDLVSTEKFRHHMNGWL